MVGLRASNGLPAIAPPWASIVAYDLNEGIIKWRTPLGIVRALAAKGIKDTGNPVRLHRTGLVATAGGLIFVGTNGDGYVRAFDKDTGKVLWEHDLNANPEGLPRCSKSTAASTWCSPRRITPACHRVISPRFKARLRIRDTTFLDRRNEESICD